MIPKTIQQKLDEGRSYRAVAQIEIRAAGEGEEERMTVEGYATTFDDPYVLWQEDGYTVKEQVARDAFDGADMSDVIFQYDHEGRVYARQSNGTLELGVDGHGLKVRADLSKTEGARQLYEEIRSGMITQMSFAFTVAEDDYNKREHLRTVKRVRKLFDVSAVSIPANPGTEISARSYAEGVIEQERLERAEAEERDRKVRALKLRLSL